MSSVATPALATPSRDPAERRKLVGARVRKWFSDPPGWYFGTVAAYDAKYQWYRVRYDDGDSEELTTKELMEVLAAAEQAEAEETAAAASNAAGKKGSKNAAGKAGSGKAAAAVAAAAGAAGPSAAAAAVGDCAETPDQQVGKENRGRRGRAAAESGGKENRGPAQQQQQQQKKKKKKKQALGKEQQQQQEEEEQQEEVLGENQGVEEDAAGGAVEEEEEARTQQEQEQGQEQRPPAAADARLPGGSGAAAAAAAAADAGDATPKPKKPKTNLARKMTSGCLGKRPADKAQTGQSKRQQAAAEGGSKAGAKRRGEGGAGGPAAAAAGGGLSTSSGEGVAAAAAAAVEVDASPPAAPPAKRPRKSQGTTAATAGPSTSSAAAAPAAKKGRRKASAAAAATDTSASAAASGASGSGTTRRKSQSAAAAAASDAEEEKVDRRRNNSSAPPAEAGISEELALQVFGAEGEVLWMVDGDSLETKAFENDEALKAHLVATQTEHAPGSEPYLSLGLPVNLDEHAGGDEAARAVQKAHDEFYREWRRAVSSEGERVALEQKRRDEEDAQLRAQGKPPPKRKALSRRPDRVAESTMLGRAGPSNEARAVNQQHGFGHMPGIKVGFKAFLRSEALVVGLHRSPLAGMVQVPAPEVKRMTDGKLSVPVVCSIVVSGSYEDDADGIDELVYTGAGGNDLLGNRRQEADQYLTGCNRALLANIALGVPVRVTRKNTDEGSFAGAIFVYDGLYNVVSFAKTKGKGGFVVWRYLLRRRTGQPDSICKPINFGEGFGGGVISAKPDASLKNRPNVIFRDLSKGLERLPVVVVNEVDRELPPGIDPETDAEWIVDDRPEEGPLIPAPYPLRYITAYEYDTGVDPPQDDDLEPHEWLALLNRGPLPYTEASMKGQPSMVARDLLSVIIECGDWTGCQDEHCPQRVAQRGLQYRLEVFKTRGRGWGVRSWDTIPCGALVAIFWGKVFKGELAGHPPFEDDTYHFDCTVRLDVGDDHKPLPKGQQRTDVTSKYIICAKHQGGVARFINHSCSPNLYVQPFCVGHADRKMVGIGLFAGMPIPAWTELTYDYGEQYLAHNDDMEAGCGCGAPCCRRPRAT